MMHNRNYNVLAARSDVIKSQGLPIFRHMSPVTPHMAIRSRRGTRRVCYSSRSRTSTRVTQERAVAAAMMGRPPGATWGKASRQLLPAMTGFASSTCRRKLPTGRQSLRS